MLTFLLHPLHVHQLLHVVGIIQPQLHPDKGLSSLQTQFVPGLGASEKVRDGALGEPQDRLPKQTLTWEGSKPSRHCGVRRPPHVAEDRGPQSLSVVAARKDFNEKVVN